MRNHNTVLLILATICAPTALLASGAYAALCYTTATLYGLAPGNTTPTHINPYQDPANYIVLAGTLTPAVLTLAALLLPPPPQLRHPLILGIINIILAAIATTIVITATLLNADTINKRVDTMTHITTTTTPATSTNAP